MLELGRRGHFLGPKLRSLRRRNGLTLEELSVRCIQRNADIAPSVSYLSMIESGKRTPSAALLELLAAVFQRAPAWFLDESAEPEPAPPEAGAAAATRMPFEPAFLFSRSLLQ
jgi:transcriptional regulator with XRE-family HTH domain